MIRTQDAADAQEFDAFVARSARYKPFAEMQTICAPLCRAAKWNMPASLHRQITMDARTGAWLIAAGTVIDTKHPAADGNLDALLQDYLAKGEQVFARCDGQFALALYDAPARRALIVSDAFGYFSIFYGARNGRTFVSTSALAVAEQIDAAADPLAVHCFLQTGKVFGEMTLWRGVKRLTGATVLQLDAQETRRAHYWTLTPDPSLEKLSLTDAVDASVTRVGAILKNNLAREGKMWSDLTGGFDTRVLTFFLTRAQLPFKANFVGPAEHEDVRLAQKIVKRFGWEHEHFELQRDWAQCCVTLLDEALGRGDAHLNVLLLLRALWVHKQEACQTKLLLGGLGGEIWRGLAWWPERAALGATAHAHYDRQLWSIMHPLPQEIFAADMRAQVRAAVMEQFAAVGEREPDAMNTLKLDRVYTFRETAHAGAWTSFGASMLRVLAPLFSKEIVRHVISLDYRWRKNNALVKTMLEKYNPALAQIPVEGRGPAVPLRVSNSYRFAPAAFAQGRKAARKFAQVRFGKALWSDVRAEGYSRAAWRNAILDYAAPRAWLDPAQMRSANLYDAEALTNFLARARTPTFHADELLGRILTVEMALDAVNTSLDGQSI